MADIQWDGFVKWTDTQNLPKRSGVYGVFCAGQCIYVGATKNLRDRFYRHHREAEFITANTSEGEVMVCWRVCHVDTLRDWEKYYIFHLKPKRNGEYVRSNPKRTIADDRELIEAKRRVNEFIKKYHGADDL